MISGCNRKTEDTVTFGNGFRHIEYLVDARPCGGLHGKCNAAKMIVLSFNAGTPRQSSKTFPAPPALLLSLVGHIHTHGCREGRQASRIIEDSACDTGITAPFTRRPTNMPHGRNYRDPRRINR